MTVPGTVSGYEKCGNLVNWHRFQSARPSLSVEYVTPQGKYCVSLTR